MMMVIRRPRVFGASVSKVDQRVFKTPSDAAVSCISVTSVCVWLVVRGGLTHTHTHTEHNNIGTHKGKQSDRHTQKREAAYRVRKRRTCARACHRVRAPPIPSLLIALRRPIADRQLPSKVASRQKYRPNRPNRPDAVPPIPPRSRQLP